MESKFSRRKFIDYSWKFTSAGMIFVRTSGALAAEPEDYFFGPTGTSRYLKGIYRPENTELTKPTEMLRTVQAPPKSFKMSGVFLQQSSNSILAEHTLNYHWFDGDGKPCAIIFNQGVPKMVSRFVATDKYLREKEIASYSSNVEKYKNTAQGLYGPLPEGYTRNYLLKKRLHLENTANTDFFWHKPSDKKEGRLLATWYGNTEDGQIHPDGQNKSKSGYYLNPENLETQAHEDLRDKLDGTPLRGIPAHVKHDARTNDAYFLDHQLMSEDISIGHINPLDGSIEPLTNTLNLGRQVFFHDWFMTSLGVVVPATPFGPSKRMGAKKIASNSAVRRNCEKNGDVNNTKFGFFDFDSPERTLVLDKDDPAYFYYVAREDDEQKRFLKGDIIRFVSSNPSFISHTVNAWHDEHGDVILVASRMDKPGQSPEDTKNIFGLNSAKESPKMIHTQFACDLYYWRLPLSEVKPEDVIPKGSNPFERLKVSKMGHAIEIKDEGRLLNLMNDFPRVNPNYLGYPAQFVYLPINSIQVLKGENHNKLRFDKVMKIDIFKLLQGDMSDFNHQDLEQLQAKSGSVYSANGHLFAEFADGKGKSVFGGEVAYMNSVTSGEGEEKEDDGYLVQIIYDDGNSNYEFAEDRVTTCQCRVYSAKDLSVVGCWELPIRVACGAHTTWIPGADLR